MSLSSCFETRRSALAFVENHDPAWVRSATRRCATPRAAAVRNGKPDPVRRAGDDRDGSFR